MCNFIQVFSIPQVHSLISQTHFLSLFFFLHNFSHLSCYSVMNIVQRRFRYVTSCFSLQEVYSFLFLHSFVEVVSGVVVQTEALVAAFQPGTPGSETRKGQYSGPGYQGHRSGRRHLESRFGWGHGPIGVLGSEVRL